MKGHSLNKIARDLFEKDVEFRDYVSTLAKKQISRRKADYSSLSIFEAEDLEQEIWANLFESECANKKSLENRAGYFVESFARHGDRKRKNMTIQPVSQLFGKDRDDIDDLFYSSESAASDGS